MMTIVDHRDIESDLVEFDTLNGWDMFEIPDMNGLYMKIEEEMVAFLAANTQMVNSIRLDYPMTGFKYVFPNAKVRPLDVEIHINGVKKF